MKHTKDLHVVYIITKLELGGAQKVCLSLFEGLQRQNIDTYLISGNEGILKEKVADNPQVILLDSFRRSVSLKQVLLEIKTFMQLIRELRKIKNKHPNTIVHTHSTKAGIVGRWAAFFAGIKTRIHTIHGYAFHNHQRRLVWWAIYLIELFTCFITTHFVCVSSADVKSGIRLFPRFSKKHSIIRAAVDWQQFYTPARTIALEKEEEDRPFVFGTISCFKPQKNLFDLLEAFRIVYEQIPHARLEIIGDGEQRIALEEWINHHGLDMAIVLHGWQDKVAPIMKHWDAFMLSSLWEGLPCSVVEARLMGLPVIAYNTGGIHDVIMHGTNGFLVPQKDITGLSDKMLLVAQNKEVRNYLRTHHENLEDFKTESMVQSHHNLYRKV
jgi:glycosyltransferase involved in cell wall biosynthesis